MILMKIRTKIICNNCSKYRPLETYTNIIFNPMFVTKAEKKENKLETKSISSKSNKSSSKSKSKSKSISRSQSQSKSNDSHSSKSNSSDKKPKFKLIQQI